MENPKNIWAELNIKADFSSNELKSLLAQRILSILNDSKLAESDKVELELNPDVQLLLSCYQNGLFFNQ